MDVRIAGEGPAAAAVEAALSDAPSVVETPVETGSVDPGQIGGAAFAVVVGDDEALATADAAATGPWVGIELGSVGGRATADFSGASIAGFGPEVACYDCLRTRVAAAGDPEGARPVDPPQARYAGAVAGRELLAQLATGEGRLFVRAPGGRASGLLEPPGTARTLLPVPGCSCDGGERFREFEDDYRSLADEAATERMERALDERVGLVGSVGEAESWPVPYYLAQLSNTDGFSDATAPRQAAGVDPDWTRAFLSALGEGLERYSAAVYRGEDLRRGPASAVEGAIAPSAFVRADDDLVEGELAWVPATELGVEVGAERAALPADAALFPPPGEGTGLPATTTGLGLGSSGVEAALAGLYEVIERDAALLAWYSTYEPLRLAMTGDGPEAERFDALRRRARSEALSTSVALVTADVDVPVVVAGVSREEFPRFAAGMAADLDPAAAATDALAEALQNWTELRGMGPEAASEEPSAIGEYAREPDPAREFLDGDGPVPVEEVGPEDTPTGGPELAAVVDRVRAVDRRVVVADLTPRDVRTAGFRAVRVAVPGAQPVFTGEPVFGERARSVPADLGFEARLDRAHHPYP
jgi:ribosomal protein S12 methylthiotransferase accessory factor